MGHVCSAFLTSSTKNFMFRSEVEAARTCTSVLHIRVREENGSITCDHDSENRATLSIRILPLGAWRECRKKWKTFGLIHCQGELLAHIMCCWCLQPKITSDVENGNLFSNWHESLSISSALRRDSHTFTPFSFSRQLCNAPDLH